MTVYWAPNFAVGRRVKFSLGDLNLANAPGTEKFCLSASPKFLPSAIAPYLICVL